VQTFFRTGGLQKYFVVNLGEVEDKENLGNERRLKRRLAEFQLTQESVKQDLQILEDAAKTDRTG
jgi:truncated hemoglobin YjbI